MSTRKLFAGALVSLLVSLAVYAVLTGLLSWWYHAGFLGNPEVAFGPSRLAWMERFWLALSFFVVPICLWWLATFLAEWRWQAPVHRRFARADLWLLLAAILWGLLVYAAASGRFLPREFYNCFEDRPEFAGLMGTCGRVKPAYFWAVTGLAAVFFLIGLVHRLGGFSRRALPTDMDALRNQAVATWIKTIPSEKLLSRYLERLPDALRDEVERSARGLHAAAQDYLDEAAKAGDVDLDTFCPALEAHLKGRFPWMSEIAFRALTSNIAWYSWHEGYSVNVR